MRTTVVILSVDEAPMLERCLPAAAAQPDVELLVIDNACTDHTAELARAHGARLVELEPRRSYAAAMNAGLAAVHTPAVLILNADCFLEPGFLAAALPRLREPEVGSVAGLLVRLDGCVDAAGMFINRRRRNGLVGHGEPLDDHTAPGEVFGADGACALYRREVLDACALPEVFDTDMALWATDADLAWRARRLGWRCAYEPAARASHVRTYSKSTRSRISEDHRRLQFRNRYLMWFKNDTPRDLLATAPFWLPWELLGLAYVLLRERHLLRGYGEAWRLLPAMRPKRRLVRDAVRRRAH